MSFFLGNPNALSLFNINQILATEKESADDSTNAGKKRDVPDEETALEHDVISPSKKQATAGETVEEKKDEGSTDECGEKPEGEESKTKPIPTEDAVKELDEPSGKSNSEEVAVGQ